MQILDFQTSKKLLLKYKIPFLETEIFRSEKKARQFAKKLKFPVVLKVFSSKIFHRTDIGGIKVGIKNEKEFEKTFSKLSKIPKAEGVLVQKMGWGLEIGLGMKKDPVFGPVLMFGLGGIFIETLKDVSFRICPLSKKTAREMIKEIKGYPILKGQRGQKAVNIEELVKIILQLSKLSLKEKEIKEIDFNPIFIDEKTAKAADFKFFT